MIKIFTLEELSDLFGAKWLSVANYKYYLSDNGAPNFISGGVNWKIDYYLTNRNFSADVICENKFLITPNWEEALRWYKINVKMKNFR